MNDAFGSLSPHEVESAHATYLAVFNWLKSIGVRQWLVTVPLESFRGRQQRGELFGYRIDDQLAAVVTLASEVSPYWLDEIGAEPRWWLKTLIVPRKHHGKGVGEKMIAACENHMRRHAATEVHLDCVVTGFFPAYYEQVGYAERSRKDITYPSGNTFHVALMRKQLS